jgi:hypothetical protein
MDERLLSRACARCKSPLGPAKKTPARFCSQRCALGTDLTGARFGKLTALRPGPPAPGPKTTWWVRCDCGNEKVVRTYNLRAGTATCGCATLKHGHARRGTVKGTPVYRSWRSMLRRCNDPKQKQYHDYGGRGISVHPDWCDFAAFYAHMGDRPEGTTLDRIDTDGNYEPGNCRWATRSEQRRNQRNWFSSRRRSYPEPVSPSRCSGSRSATAKLTEGAVIEMRRRYDAGAAICDLAREFAVSPEAALRAVKRRTWRHVA